MTIPFDILSNISEILSYEHDIKTLRSLSLCSQALVPLCQRHLFHTICVPNTSGRTFTLIDRGRYLDRFHKALSSSPQIGTYVRHLHYFVDHNDREFGMASSILKRLTQVKAFKIEYRAHEDPRLFISWKRLSENRRLASAITSIIKQPTPCSLSIVNISSFPPSILASITSPLLDLDIRFLDVDKSGNINEALAVGWSQVEGVLPCLSSLEIRDSKDSATTVIALAGKLFDFSRIESVVVEWDDEEPVGAAKALLKLTPALKDLRVQVNTDINNCGGIADCILQGAHQKLTTLKLDLGGRRHDLGGSIPIGPFAGVVAELAMISGCCDALETIAVMLRYVNRDSWLSIDWAPFDNVITSKSFPRLRVLTIEMVFIWLEDLVNRALLERETEAGCVRQLWRIRDIPGLDFRCTARIERC
ncbi:hypothetical protein NLJ89_g4380 [Agrocybe chaxingu]|uniref:Uncharacterized protein n=1 Tax=Agrocybe chaxingu TaxID=84603 RepID=A0A9W8K8U2_9AGAR|nr:hypothetical protein NLJ89_g4380 [Agrocybe chaxingu]